MANVPAIVSKRMSAEVPKFQKILQNAYGRDVNEADTVVIIADMLEAVFGYDKYTELTREAVIKGTFCDLAVRLDGKMVMLIEVKAIGTHLDDKHLRQAVHYGSDSGIAWVILTNGIHWQLHKITVDGKVTNEKFLEFNFLELSARKKEDQEILFTLCRRAHDKDVITEVYEYKQSVNPQTLASLLLTEDSANRLRLMLRRIKPGLKVQLEEIESILRDSVIKRDLVSSDDALNSHKQIKRILTAQKKKKAAK